MKPTICQREQLGRTPQERLSRAMRARVIAAGEAMAPPPPAPMPRRLWGRAGEQIIGVALIALIGGAGLLVCYVLLALLFGLAPEPLS